MPADKKKDNQFVRDCTRNLSMPPVPPWNRKELIISRDMIATWLASPKVDPQQTDAFLSTCFEVMLLEFQTHKNLILRHFGTFSMTEHKGWSYTKKINSRYYTKQKHITKEAYPELHFKASSRLRHAINNPGVSPHPPGYWGGERSPVRNALRWSGSSKDRSFRRKWVQNIHLKSPNSPGLIHTALLLQQFLDLIAESLCKHKEVSVTDVIRFFVRPHKAHTGRNPHNGSPMLFPASWRVHIQLNQTFLNQQKLSFWFHQKEKP